VVSGENAAKDARIAEKKFRAQLAAEKERERKMEEARQRKADSDRRKAERKAAEKEAKKREKEARKNRR
jgi:hypothetical protein